MDTSLPIIYNVYCYRDRIGGNFLNPQIITDGPDVVYTNLCRNIKTGKAAQNPAIKDYELYHLGKFNDVTGVIEILDGSPLFIGNFDQAWKEFEYVSSSQNRQN